MPANKPLFYTWKKGEEGPLSPHFDRSEFTCKCLHESCVEQKISIKLVDLLEKLREAAKTTIRVHSAFRCALHQKSLRAKGIKTAVGVSQHEKGEAVDVSASRLIPQHLLPLAASVGFKAIGIAPNFLHLDLRDDKERRWRY